MREPESVRSRRLRLSEWTNLESGRSRVAEMPARVGDARARDPGALRCTDYCSVANAGA
jgi:hypothetical protein